MKQLIKAWREYLVELGFTYGANARPTFEGFMAYLDYLVSKEKKGKRGK